ELSRDSNHATVARQRWRTSVCAIPYVRSETAPILVISLKKGSLIIVRFPTLASLPRSAVYGRVSLTYCSSVYQIMSSKILPNREQNADENAITYLTFRLGFEV